MSEYVVSALHLEVRVLMQWCREGLVSSTIVTFKLNMVVYMKSIILLAKECNKFSAKSYIVVNTLHMTYLMLLSF